MSTRKNASLVFALSAFGALTLSLGGAEAQSKRAGIGAAPMPVAVQGQPGRIVRNHRGWNPSPQGGVTVYSHRPRGCGAKYACGGGPQLTRETGMLVRDHRTRDSGPTIRDHRGRGR